MADEGLRDELRAFVDEREWGQFRTQENLAKSISLEAAEMLECFQWKAEADDSCVGNELADALTYCFFLADRLGTSPEILICEKLAITKAKYPVERTRGRSTKYDRL